MSKPFLSNVFSFLIQSIFHINDKQKYLNSPVRGYWTTIENLQAFQYRCTFIFKLVCKSLRKHNNHNLYV